MFLGDFYFLIALTFSRLMLIYFEFIIYLKKVTCSIENSHFDSFSLESTLCKAFITCRTCFWCFSMVLE